MQPKILLVDDDEENFLKVVIDRLRVRLPDVRVDWRTTIQAAENFIAMNLPDIVVVDMNLPLTPGDDPEDGAGMQLVGFVRRMTNRTVIILVTGETRPQMQDEYLNRGLSAGVNEVILKESRVNYVELLIARIAHLTRLLLKLRTSVGKNIGDNILLHRLSPAMVDYYCRRFSQYTFIPVDSVQAAMDACDRHLIQACIVAVEADRDACFQFIRRFYNLRRDIPVVALTTQDSVRGFDGLKRALRDGAMAAVRHVEDSDYADAVLDKTVRFRQAKLDRFDDVVGTHPALLKALGLADIAARSSGPVLIAGESGTGKELVANGINRLSGRTGGYVNLNCACLPGHLLESELFGHEKGAFTGASRMKEGLFAKADGGTIFLDEITELPLDMQAKLLKVIENMTLRRVGGTETIRLDVKVIAATNRNIARMVRRGEFRNDLYQRLKVFTVTLPSLAERASDVPRLVYYYIDRISKRENKGVIGIDEDAMALISTHDWSNGNVRELKNALEKIIAYHPEGRESIHRQDVAGALGDDLFANNAARTLNIDVPPELKLKEAEKWAGFKYCLNHLKLTLTRHNSYSVGDDERNAVMRKLGIGSPTTFYGCVDKGLELAAKISRRANGDASVHEALKLIDIGNNKGVEKFVRDRFNRTDKNA